MGRDKDKGANRTKGNTKPANSGRSAELLQSFGKEGLIPTSLLLGGTSPFAQTSSPSSQTDESQLDTNITILLKKLGKKDPTTKIKALGELNEIFTEDPEVCNQILKYWPNYYVKLARDDDRKVRELSHTTLQLIGNNVGRNLATQIKNLFPVWFLSTSDTFPIVASKAQSTFLNIFPTVDKQVQVCRFCSKEIFAFIRNEKLFGGNELGKVTGIEAVIKLIQMGLCDGEGDGEGQGQEQNLGALDIDMESDVFWNLGKDESALVRRSFYTLLTLMAEKQLERLSPKKQRLNQIMKSSLVDEKSELEALWNCYLTLIMNGFYPDKQFAKKQILICLKNGFYGNSSILGPLLLPLVSKIGPFTGEEIFVALGRGYDLEKGTSEGAAIMRTYAEILAYEFQTTKQVPAHTFPFLSQNLSASPEFGRVIGNMLKASANSFYEELKTYIFNLSTSQSVETDKEENELELLKSPNFGHFILSFFEPIKKRGTKFRDASTEEDMGSSKSNLKYDDLDPVKKLFVSDISKKLIELKYWKPFSIISRNLGTKEFYEAVITDDANDFAFTPEDKLEGLRITLDQLSFQFPTTTSNFQKFLQQYLEEENIGGFLREIQLIPSHWSVVEIGDFLKSQTFLSNRDGSVTKYILRAGTRHYTPDVISGRVQLLCESLVKETDLDFTLVQEIMNLGLDSRKDSFPKVDMSGLYLRIFQMFLNHQSQGVRKEEAENEFEGQVEQEADNRKEKIESLVSNILRNNRVQGAKLFQEVLNWIPKCRNTRGLDNLVDTGLKIMDTYEVKDCTGQIRLHPDLLALLGFSTNPKLMEGESSTPRFWKIRVPEDTNQLKFIYFESRLTIQMKKDGDDSLQNLIQLGLNLLYAITVHEVWKEMERYNWNWKPMDYDYCEALHTELTRVLELLETPSNLLEFWSRLETKCTTESKEDSIWASKYPKKYLLQTCQKMELVIPKLPEVIPRIEDMAELLDYVQHPEANVDKLIQTFVKERNTNSGKFKFDTLFACLRPEEQNQLLGYLALTMELLEKDADFASTAACWISAWLKSGKTIGNTKIGYLWVQKLSQAACLIDSIAKTQRGSEFVLEYMDFHSRNIFPVVYSHFVQLTTESEDDGGSEYRYFCSLSVCASVALIPTPVLLSIEPDSAVIFEIFTPILMKRSVPFKLAAYHVMRKTKVKDEIIIPKELSQLLSRKVHDEKDHDKVLGLLLGWDVLLKSQQNAFELANFVKTDDLLPKLLSLLFFKLLPDTNLKPLFDTRPILVSNALPSIPHWACSVIQEILRSLPYTVRWWWSLNLKEQRERILVEKIITKYLSAKLAAEELGKVQWNELHGDSSSDAAGAANSDNVTVDSHPGCNELIAKYKIEETNVVLKITLPLNHPLGAVQVHISDRKLLAKITQLLNTRSHSLSTGLKLWKESLDNIYKDVDECAICFFILHHVKKALPKLACAQCRKKFHAACLYKWFSTSNKSECPLCRNLF